MPPFDALLVANRGEVACRIIASARALGLRTVAVFSDADRASPHVRLADEAIRLGPGAARDSYLLAERIVEAALGSGAGAIHPGYGFLSESVELATLAEQAGVTFVGPTTDQLRLFGQKHTARAAAAAAGLAVLAGGALLEEPADSHADPEGNGGAVVVKATGGGGGIGMQVCRDADELVAAFAAVRRVAIANFGSSGVYLERFVPAARHLEVQVFGDGAGRVLVLGDRDCSLQRRNQKVIEEAPAPRLPEAVREGIASASLELCRSVAYRSAGTVEFVYDPAREQAYFLEVNTRLQVEHRVTEALLGIDLVEWMLRLAAGERDFLDVALFPRGHAIEARVYAEDPTLDYRPSAGLVSEVAFPVELRVDTWIEAGTEVTTFYDPLLAKLVAHAPDRATAIRDLAAGLAASRVEGIETNLAFARSALLHPAFASATHSTSTLAELRDPRPRIEVGQPGVQTTVQAWPGRLGYWGVGIPPSGPIDERSFRLGNAILGNDEGAPGLECVLAGPTLAFSCESTVCITGAQVGVTLDGTAVPMWRPLSVPAGATLAVGAIDGPGLRSYLLVRGGIDVPEHLGSAATFTLGGFGGHEGRALRAGDVLHPSEIPEGRAAAQGFVPPEFPNAWSLAVLEGPHGAPEFFTDGDLERFYSTEWQVHFNSDRTGVRLVGPSPSWAREDGGEAGLHPSNIHDSAYAIGAVNFTGDTPVLLGPDGPSLGGFVCPATVISSERWKLGQLRPGDTLRFVAVSAEAAAVRRREARTALAAGRWPPEAVGGARRRSASGVLSQLAGGDGQPLVTYRRAGDDYLLVEYGPMALDFGLRLRVHSLSLALQEAASDGIVDLTPGIRSLQIHVDPERLSVERALAVARELEAALPAADALSVESRTVHLPLSWDDPATREAISRYMAGVRDDAPWCPWNIEFIRRMNGLADTEEVRRIVHEAEYLVLGLGDVYLGAPVATPLDPRHRLVTTKYNPARTWTPENAVGIGGAYLCIYGMEGPGGYQFVGRTVPVWNRWHSRRPFEEGVPWLLRHFDRIRWYPVSSEELLDLRADMTAGRLDLRIDAGRFTLAEHERFLSREAEGIAAFQARQGAAFEEERERWRRAGEFDRQVERQAAPERGSPGAADLPPGGRLITAPLAGSLWKVDAQVGTPYSAGERLFTLEAMKLEVPVHATRPGSVHAVLVRSGEQVPAGHPLAVVIES